MALEAATFGAGRFWDTEAVFQHIRGVKTVQPGYAGGSLVRTSYEEVCSGETGHAEVVQVVFDTAVVSYAALLEVFFKIHDPCAQSFGDDIKASPHRSVVLFHSIEQKRQATEAFKKQERICCSKLRTELAAYQGFIPAEPEHRNFYKMNRNDPYCQEFIVPKIIRSREIFARKKMAA